MKRFSIIFVYVMSIVSLLVATPVAAIDEGFYGSNDILFYNPDDEGTICLSEGSAGISGVQNTDKIWNWLIGKGMTDIGAAGIMGNMQVESGFNPFRIQGGAPLRSYSSMVGSSAYNSAFGLVQWDGTRRQEVLRYIAGKNSNYKQYVSDKYGRSADDYQNAPTDVLDAFLGHELDFLHKEATPGGGRPTTWRNLIEARTPAEAANVFEEIFEGSVRTGGGPHVDAAKEIFAKYSGIGTAAGENSGCDTGGGSIAEGGLTEQQAKQFVMNYGANRGGDSAKYTYGNWDNCNGGGSNCVTFSQFFLNKFTSEGQLHTMGNGEAVVGNLSKKGVPTGKTPRVYAVFSWDNGGYGHTGVVLGVRGDTVIVGHASCGHDGIGKGDGTYAGGGSGFIKVGKISNSSVWLGHDISGITFAYPRNVDTAKIQEYIN